MLKRQREVPEVFFAVGRALHGAEDEVREEAVLGPSFHFPQDALQFGGTDLLRVAAQRQLELLQDLAKVLQLLRVGLLVDAAGFPLEVVCFEGNKAETTTILPIVKAFAERQGGSVRYETSTSGTRFIVDFPSGAAA